MARVKWPLGAVEASGKFENWVFDKRGRARKFVAPSNPQTVAQGNNRQLTGSAQNSVSAIGSTTVAEIKTFMTTQTIATKNGDTLQTSQWNAYLVKRMLGDAYTEIANVRAAYAALTAGEQAAWDTEAAGAAFISLSPTTLAYATDAPMTAGEQLFAIARTIYYMKVYGANGLPGGTNATTWATSIAA